MDIISILLAIKKSKNQTEKECGYSLDIDKDTNEIMLLSKDGTVLSKKEITMIWK